MWITPKNLKNPALLDFTQSLGCRKPKYVQVKPEPDSIVNNCHNNVERYILFSPACERVVGYYIVESIFGYQAIYHSVISNEYDELIDITPYHDNRAYILFCESINQKVNYELRNKYYHFLDKYKKPENDIMYYVYQIVDPRTGIPFYIGKGTGNRAQQHLWNISREQNKYKNNKIEAIRKDGFEPEIIMIAENIESEELAYDMEEATIKHYGRKGYEDGGILTNVCLNSRPPNHRGKTYEEIYGSKERAEEEIEKRRKTQIARGGFGPKKHKPETIEKLKKASLGNNNPMYGKKHKNNTKKKISKANSGRFGKINKNSK